MKFQPRLSFLFALFIMLGDTLYTGTKPQHPNWSYPVSTSSVSDHIFAGNTKMPAKDLAQEIHNECRTFIEAQFPNSFINLFWCPLNYIKYITSPFFFEIYKGQGWPLTLWSYIIYLNSIKWLCVLFQRYFRDFVYNNNTSHMHTTTLATLCVWYHK